MPNIQALSKRMWVCMGVHCPGAVFCGAVALIGRGKGCCQSPGCVVAVGESSEWGKTMLLVGEAGSDSTPLQDKLEVVAGAVGKVGMFVAAACFLALLIKWMVINKGFPG